MAGDDQDPHKNNGGVTVGSETDYGTWDWRKVKVAIVGSFNTDVGTEADKLPGTSDPQSLLNASDAFYYTTQNLQTTYDSLKYWHDYLLNPDQPLWRGDAADAFRSLLDKAISSVRGHLDPLTNTPSYAQSLYDAHNDLDIAIKTIMQQDYDATRKVIERWNKEANSGRDQADFTYYDEQQTAGPAGSPPWYNYNGTTIFIISHYPDIDNQLSVDMRGTLQRLVGQYKGHLSSMPPPAPLPSPDPGPPGGASPNPNPQTIEFGKPPPIKFGNQPKLGDNNPANVPNGLKAVPDGQLPGPDGKQPNGDPNLVPPNFVNTPNGPAVVGPDGKTLLDPRTGKPLKGPDGKPLTANDPSSTGVVPPVPTPPPVVKTAAPPKRNTPGGFKEPPAARPLNESRAGEPPVKPPSELQSEGGLKPGAKEFGGLEGAGGGTGAARGGGEPMPMGGAPTGAGAGDKDRDRTTWLVEDKEVWGAETPLGVGVLGRYEMAPNPAS